MCKISPAPDCPKSRIRLSNCPLLMLASLARNAQSSEVNLGKLLVLHISTKYGRVCWFQMSKCQKVSCDEIGQHWKAALKRVSSGSSSSSSSMLGCAKKPNIYWLKEWSHTVRHLLQRLFRNGQSRNDSKVETFEEEKYQNVKDEISKYQRREISKYQRWNIKMSKKNIKMSKMKYCKRRACLLVRKVL